MERFRPFCAYFGFHVTSARQEAYVHSLMRCITVFIVVVVVVVVVVAVVVAAVVVVACVLCVSDIDECIQYAASNCTRPTCLNNAGGFVL